MRIDHIAIWTHDLERLRYFYTSYFHATASGKYTNHANQFESYCLSFDSGTRLEIMRRPGIPASHNDPVAQFTGLIHFAIAVGSNQQVDALTMRLKNDGYRVLDGPRTTGDGYYESVVLDPDGNRIELTV